MDQKWKYKHQLRMWSVLFNDSRLLFFNFYFILFFVFHWYKVNRINQVKKRFLLLVFKFYFCSSISYQISFEFLISLQLKRTLFVNFFVLFCVIVFLLLWLTYGYWNMIQTSLSTLCLSTFICISSESENKLFFVLYMQNINKHCVNHVLIFLFVALYQKRT